MAGSDDERERDRRAALRLLDRYETRLRDALNALAVDASEEAVAALHARRTGKVSLPGANPRRWRLEAERIGDAVVMDIYREILNPGPGDADRRSRAFTAGVQTASSTTVMSSARVRRAVRDRVRQIAATTEARAARIADAILDIDDDGPIDDVIDSVRGTYEQHLIWSTTVARTEVARAVNHASLFGAIDQGLATKEWLTSHDDRVRTSHVIADAQVVPIDRTFRVGRSRLRYPSDPTGPAGEVINCRCVMRFGPAPKSESKRKAANRRERALRLIDEPDDDD